MILSAAGTEAFLNTSSWFVFVIFFTLSSRFLLVFSCYPVKKISQLFLDNDFIPRPAAIYTTPASGIVTISTG